MKKYINILFTVLVLATWISGCALSDKANNDWTVSANNLLDAAITEENLNEFYLNGVIYSFPCEVKTFLDNGWYIANISPDEILDAGSYSDNDKIALRNQNNNQIIIYVCNWSDKPVSVKDASVYGLLLDSSSGNVMTSGGFTIGDTKLTGDSIISSFVNGGLEPSVSGNEFLLYGSTEDYMIKTSFGFVPNSTEYCLNSIEYSYYMYNFTQDVENIINAFAFNDPSLLIRQWFNDSSPEEFVASYRGNNGYLTWAVSTAMGFKFDEFTQEQTAMIDEIISAAYKTCSLNFTALNNNSCEISGSSCNIDEIVYWALQRLINDYPDLDISNFSYSDDCFEKMCDEMLVIYSDGTVSPTDFTYIADRNSEYIWDNLAFISVGMVNYL